MTRFTKVMMAATALSMMAGVSFAQSSIADVDQDGNRNDALVNQNTGEDHRTYLDQEGNRNNADVSQRSNSSGPFFNPNGNKFGTSADNALQRGNRNTVEVQQDFVGNNGNEVGTGGTGFDQVGDDNVARITQDGSRNLVIEVLQDSDGEAGGNRLVIGQGRSADLSGYAYNRINSVLQDGGNNDARVIQRGASSSGQLNRIGEISQVGDGNDANVVQTGDRNSLGIVSQEGDGNVLTLTLRGNRNGSTLADGLNEQLPGTFGVVAGRGFAASTGVIQGSAIQDGDGNDLDVAVVGDLNLVGFNQSGNGNFIFGDVRGESNELAVLQTQTGGTGYNDASIFVNGDSNDVGVRQNIAGGSRNALVDLDIRGDSNSLNIVQANNGNGRNALVDISITGDFNNSVTAFEVGGDASSVLNSSRRNAGSGQVSQSGSGSQLTYDVVGDLNRFAFYQTSTNNTIGGSTTGDNNQVAVVQSSLGNTANFVQDGNFNNIGISQ